ncbi:MAG: hypothetical protein ABI318_07225 [Chthoniobacteraceae bacterium]
MQTESAVKTWEKTPRQNLVRHKSGRYYARLFLNGKEIWRSLKTSHFSVAEAWLATAVKDHRERKSREVDPSNARMTFGEAATLHIRRVDENVSLKRPTRIYWHEVLKALLKSWPTLAATEIRRITAASCREWGGAPRQKVQRHSLQRCNFAASPRH